MCRHLAYLGPPASLRSLLIDPPHSLYRQAWAPRMQRHGTVNADGFGIGWYASADPVPARYRRGEPIWGDPSLPDLARVTSSGAVLAAVRSATPGTAAGPEAAAPFGRGPWLFSHNGAARGWRDWGEAAYASLPDPARSAAPPADGAAAPLNSPSGSEPASLLSCLEALTDSALLWALALQRLRAGLPLDAALAGTVGTVEAAGGTGRFNLLLTDGRSVAATACGDTLWYRQTAPSAPGRAGPASVTVASEPDDDGPGWTEVPDRHVLTATPSLVRVRPLSDLPAAAPSGRASQAGHGMPAATPRPRGRSTAGHGSAAGHDLAADHASPAGKDVRTEGIVTRMTSIENRLPAGYRAASLRADALAGLTATPKSLPPKWFYDAQGSALFEKITELPEYYPTRAERSILRTVAPRIAELTGAASLVELGSGSSDKTRLLLSALRDAGTLRQYVPVDVSESALTLAGDALAAEYPGLAVHAVVADFDKYLGLPSATDAGAGDAGAGDASEGDAGAGDAGAADRGGDAGHAAGGHDDGPRLVAFLGSTIGNMVPAERTVFLRRVRALLRPGDAFLLGTDLVKDPAVLVAAYDDAAGVTAAFNKNVLAVLNAELGADFDLDSFEHVAIWDAEREWIEMRLRAASAQSVRVRDLGLTLEFADGEEMRTEVSAKFRQDGAAAELAAAGLALRSWWTDEAGQFGLSLSVPV